MHSDRDDLRAYASTGDAGAFARLVARHADMVYSACLRQLKDPARAEDAAQQVFVLLAGKARSLRADVSLAGWLYNTARFVSMNALRLDRRRRHHERRAAIREDQPMNDAPAADPNQWSEVGEVLDAAMSNLATGDRDALLLRYFQGMRLDDVATVLGVSSQAAKMRVTRALDRLRVELGRQGVTVMPAILIAGLENGAITAAPRGFCAATAQAAVAAHATTAATATAPTGASLFAKIAGLATATKAAACIAATTVAVAVGAYGYHEAAHRSASIAPVIYALAAPASQPDPLANLRLLDPLYALAPDEAARLFPPPFPKPRLDFFAADKMFFPRQGQPKFAHFDWDPDHRSLTWTMANYTNASAEEAIEQIVPMHRYLLDPKLTTIRFPGDWVFSTRADEAAKINAIAGIFTQQGHPVALDRKTVRREVIVVRRQYPLKDQRLENKLLLYGADDPDGRPIDSGGAVTSSFWRRVATETHRPVIDEAAPPPGRDKGVVMWELYRSARLINATGRDERDRLTLTLQHLINQTGLDLKREVRPIETWVFTAR